MTLIAADRVVETTVTTGTGALALGGAIGGYVPFSSAMSVGDTCYYMLEAVDATGVPTGDYELGIGTYSAADTLTRTTVQKSSNANAAVVLAAGTKRVMIAATAAYLATLGGGAAGALVLLEQHTASGGGSLDFTTGITSTYDEYVFEFVNVQPATNTVRPWIRMSTDGGATYDSGANYSDYYHSRNRFNFSGNGSEVDTSIVTMAVDHDNGQNVGINGWVRLFSPLSTTLYKTVMGEFTISNGVFVENAQFSGKYRSLTAVNAIRFLMSSGNITSGTIRMYGIAK